MEKKFIKVPSGELEKILLTARLVENLSGKKVSLREILDSLEKYKIKLTEEEIKELEKEFS